MSTDAPFLLRHHKVVVSVLTGAVLVLGAVAAADDPDDRGTTRIEDFEEFDEFELEEVPEFELPPAPELEPPPPPPTFEVPTIPPPEFESPTDPFTEP